MAWNTEKLERALRKRIVEHPITIKGGKLENHVANVDWQPANKREAVVTVDPIQGDWLGSVIHELLHLELEQLLANFGDMEEVIVEAVEAHISERIKTSKKRLAWWRSAIEAHVGRPYGR